ncbi:MAG: DUF4890 domain-containing protein [Bacteroidales bacterium]|nr:DUF4890 domain-containing protein [Bacteroidales bacterium]
MRKVFIFTVAALALSAGAFAQDFPQGPPQGGRFDPEAMIQMRTQRMVRELGLDEAQEAKLLELNKKYSDTIMARPGGRPGGPGMGRPGNPPQEGQNADAANADTKAAKKAAKKAKKEQRKQEEAQAADEAKAALEAYENELKEILTEDQFKTYQENKNRRPQGRGPGGPGGFGGPGGGPGGFGGPGGGPGGF